ncbi:MAG TPA: hypothetical protein VHZ03_54440 [Trebonia sp.]|nr:hypothetical protein [Trebonia sp.]
MSHSRRQPAPPTCSGIAATPDEFADTLGAYCPARRRGPGSGAALP